MSAGDFIVANGVRTYSAAIWSSSDDVVLEFKVWIKDRRIQLCLAIETVANAPPIICRLSHFDQSPPSCSQYHEAPRGCVKVGKYFITS